MSVSKFVKTVRDSSQLKRKICAALGRGDRDVGGCGAGSRDGGLGLGVRGGAICVDGGDDGCVATGDCELGGDVELVGPPDLTVRVPARASGLDDVFVSECGSYDPDLAFLGYGDGHRGLGQVGGRIASEKCGSRAPQVITQERQADAVSTTQM
jgi:hypothetical protein